MTLVLAHSDDPLAQAYRRRVAGGQDSNLSLLTLARQLAAIALAMWKNKEDYDPARYKPSQNVAP